MVTLDKASFSCPSALVKHESPLGVSIKLVVISHFVFC